MAWSEVHKQTSRLKILDSAAVLFMEHGFDHIGINDVMQHAGLTRGAFYNHFSSKAELYREAILRAAKVSSEGVAKQSNGCVKTMVDTYVDVNHRNGTAFRCPLAFLTTDIHHQDDDVRNVYTQIFKRLLGVLSQGDTNTLVPEVIEKSILMVGSIAISRAINDEELAQAILKTCRDKVKEGFESA